MKPWQSDCIDGLTSDHPKHTSTFKHDVVPAGLLLSILVATNKSGNICDSNHYRQIAIRSVLG